MTPYQIADRIMSEHGTSIEHDANDTYRTADELPGYECRSLATALSVAGVKCIVSNNRVWCTLQVSQPIF